MSLFAKPQPAAGTTAFGSSTTASNPFGQSAAAPASTSMFGRPAQPQTQQQQQPNGFAQSQPAQQQAGFGNSSFMRPSNFGASTVIQQQPAPVQPKSQIWEVGRDAPTQKPIPEQIKAITDKWDPGNPNCAFRYYFYNKVDQSRIPFYQPTNFEDPTEWEKAVRDRPAKDFMPALASGFAGVAERLKIQREAVAQYNARLHEINNSLDAILSKHDLETSVRALEAKRKHMVLRKRCLALATKVQVLRNRGFALGTDEDELKGKLEALDRQFEDPALSARTEELWGRLVMLQNYADTLRNEINKRGNEGGEGIGEEAENVAKKILEDYDKQLQTLKTQVDSIKKDYEEWKADRDGSAK